MALAILALLYEAPMHPYGMQRLIREREKGDVVNIAARNSIYQTIERLLRAGLIEIANVGREEGRPERTTYRITSEGRRTLISWLRTMLSVPANEFPEYPAALSFLAVLGPEEAAAELTRRIVALDARLQKIEDAMRKADGVPRLFLIEDEYMRAQIASERAWTQDIIDDLRDGRLSWNAEWIQSVAASLAPQQDDR